jgi:hypothetical protein
MGLIAQVLDKRGWPSEIETRTVAGLPFSTILSVRLEIPGVTGIICD